jgi:hypothetical protein
LEYNRIRENTTKSLLEYTAIITKKELSERVLCHVRNRLLIVGMKPTVKTFWFFFTRKLGNLKIAQIHYNTTLEINPNHVVALKYQGELFLLIIEID